MRNTIGAASLMIVAFLPAWAHAQIKLPVFEESKEKYQNVSYQEVSGRADYQHGKLVRLTMAGDGAQVSGILVRTDAAKGLVYVRTQPGQAPRAIAANDIKRIEKGVIKEASYTGDVTVPEIQEMVIYNGGRRTTAYRAPTLSPGELSQLAELEATANEIARLDETVRINTRIEMQAVENSLAMQNEQRRTLELTNELLWERLTSFGPYWGYGMGYGWWQGGWQGGFDATLLAALPIINANIGSPIVRTETTVAPKAAIATNAESLAAARRALAQTQSRAIYENGQLVAVIVNDTPSK